MQFTLTDAERSQRDLHTAEQVLASAHRGILIPMPKVTFTYDMPYGRYIWNVTAALTLVQLIPRTLYPVPADSQQRIADSTTYDPAHVATVNPDAPGIVAPLFNMESHTWENVLIDGTHRAVRAWQLTQPFQAYQLAPFESFLLLVEHPVPSESLAYVEDWIYSISQGQYPPTGPGAGRPTHGLTITPCP
jgi:hypothetical protein